MILAKIGLVLAAVAFAMLAFRLYLRLGLLIIRMDFIEVMVEKIRREVNALQEGGTDDKEAS